MATERRPCFSGGVRSGGWLSGVAVAATLALVTMASPAHGQATGAARSSTPQFVGHSKGAGLVMPLRRNAVFTRGETGELWTTNGTTKGTKLVRDITRGRRDPFPTFVASTRRLTFFWADDGVHGSELWRTNGTRRGTRMVKDIRPGKRSSNANSGYQREAAVLGNTVYFLAYTKATEYEVWKTDGTRRGTTRVSDLPPVLGGSEPRDLTAAGDSVYFAFQAADGEQLWSTRGSRASTMMLRSRLQIQIDSAGGLESTAGTLFFVATDNSRGFELSTGFELWRSSGTAASTQIVSELGRGRNSANIQGLAAAGGRAYLGRGLDALATGPFGPPVQLRNRNGTTLQVQPDSFIAAGANVFGLSRPSNGRVQLFRLGPQGQTPQAEVSISEDADGDFAANGGHVVFATENAIFRSDGTPAGTRLLARGLTWEGETGRAIATDGRVFVTGKRGRREGLWLLQDR